MLERQRYVGRAVTELSEHVVIAVPEGGVTVLTEMEITPKQANSLRSRVEAVYIWPRSRHGDCHRNVVDQPSQSGPQFAHLPFVEAIPPGVEWGVDEVAALNRSLASRFALRSLA